MRTTACGPIARAASIAFGQALRGIVAEEAIHCERPWFRSKVGIQHALLVVIEGAPALVYTTAQA
jgi:hypothetical protein